MPSKILILGSSGRVGRFLFRELGPEKAVATYFRNPFPNGIAFNSLKERLPEKNLPFESFSHAVILLGETEPDACAKDVVLSTRLNVESIERILLDLKKFKIKPIFFSTEFVFDGLKGNYTEEDEAKPTLTYGKQKMAIEKFIAAHFSDFTVVRLAKTYGTECEGGNLLTRWLEEIEKGKSIRAANDQIFSPIFVDDVVQSTIRLIEKKESGIFHLAGPEAWSRIDLLKLLMEEAQPFVSKLPTVIPCSINDFNLLEKRPLNVSMAPDKLVKTTGYQIRSVRTLCKQIVKNYYAKK